MRPWTQTQKYIHTKNDRNLRHLHTIAHTDWARFANAPTHQCRFTHKNRHTCTKTLTNTENLHTQTRTHTHTSCRHTKKHKQPNSNMWSRDFPSVSESKSTKVLRVADLLTEMFAVFILHRLFSLAAAPQVCNSCESKWGEKGFIIVIIIIWGGTHLFNPRHRLEGSIRFGVKAGPAHRNLCCPALGWAAAAWLQKHFISPHPLILQDHFCLEHFLLVLLRSGWIRGFSMSARSLGLCVCTQLCVCLECFCEEGCELWRYCWIYLCASVVLWAQSDWQDVIKKPTLGRLCTGLTKPSAGPIKVILLLVCLWHKMQ